MGKDVIIACDFSSKIETLKFLDKFKKKKPFVKIGMELFYSEGPSIVKEIKNRGHKIFLDLKLHDIPNTVNKTMKVLSKLNIDMVNCHASGSKEMMKAARMGLVNKHTLLIAVTQLTSTNQKMMKEDLLINEDLNKVVMHYAKNAKASGLNGVVCSPLEAKKVHQVCGKKFITVTPGIRFKENAKGDQKRVMTPIEAKKAGSDYIVVGRPITEAKDPVKMYERCLKEFIG